MASIWLNPFRSRPAPGAPAPTFPADLSVEEAARGLRADGPVRRLSPLRADALGVDDPARRAAAQGRVRAGTATWLAGLATAALAVLAAPAAAVDHAAVAARALEGHVLPGFDALATGAAALAAAAEDHCAGGPADLMAAYNAAFDAWMGVSHLRFGPLEEGETGFAIAFWPDTRGATPKALAALEAREDPVVDDPEAFADLSVAARGLFALDALLAEGPPAPGSYACRLAAAVAADLARTAARARDRWEDPFAGYLRAAGAAGNPLYLSPEEGSRALFTALAGGLEMTADHRLGRPLGDFARPQPRRAEAWRTGRPQRDVILAVAAARSLYEAAFAPELSEAARADVAAAFAEAERAAENMGPVEVAVTAPLTRVRVEAAQQSVRRLREEIVIEVGGALGIAGGFNSMDGD